MEQFWQTTRHLRHYNASLETANKIVKVTLGLSACFLQPELRKIENKKKKKKKKNFSKEIQPRRLAKLRF